MTLTYEWAATVLDVHDGDTVHLDIDVATRVRGKDRDLGFHLHVETGGLHYHPSVRLLGLNAPELATPAGQAAQAALVALMPPGSKVTAATHLDENDKYGRLLATLTMGDGTNVNQWLIDHGYAAPWNGQGPKPVPGG